MRIITILFLLAYIVSCQHIEYVTATDDEAILRAPAAIGSSQDTEDDKPVRVRKQTYSQKYLKRKSEENLTE